jgi:hypothetical protein
MSGFTPVFYVHARMLEDLREGLRIEVVLAALEAGEAAWVATDVGRPDCPREPRARLERVWGLLDVIDYKETGEQREWVGVDMRAHAWALPRRRPHPLRGTQCQPTRTLAREPRHLTRPRMRQPAVRTRLPARAAR